jgi:hypothetical protein
MKRKGLLNAALTFAVLFIIITLSSCHKEHCHPDKPNLPETQVPLELIQVYSKTKLYNDSLAMFHQGKFSGDSIMMRHYENQYHYYDSLMTQLHDQCHKQMMNGHSGNMMAGNNHGMMNENMKCSCMGENNDCHAMMDAVRIEHSNYHHF